MTGSPCERPAVAAWPGVELQARLRGGARNPVFRARRGADELVVRISRRPVAALEWELDLLETLHRAGVVVPRAVPTGDGRRHDGGVLVQRLLAGRPPRDAGDWARVVPVLARVHEVTRGWPQRPGFASARELGRGGRGGDVDLDAMPPDAAALVRASWAPVLDAPQCAIHGDPGRGNVLMTDDQVALIDWDKARVDVAAFDFAHVPDGVAVPLAVDREQLRTAGIAWETATCWIREPQYAGRRLVELQLRVQS